jgi:hypothetical protein
VTARGNERRDIYRDEANRLKFLELVRRKASALALGPCYVFMDDHFIFIRAVNHRA